MNNQFPKLLKIRTIGIDKSLENPHRTVTRNVTTAKYHLILSSRSNEQVVLYAFAHALTFIRKGQKSV
jgi:hypothetical protein